MQEGSVELCPDGKGVYPDAKSFWNVLQEFNITYRYAGGVEIVYRTEKPYMRFEGGSKPDSATLRRVTTRSGGWDKLIQTLDRGQYDVFGFLKALRTTGYGLQCYAIKGDRRENLKRSIGAWREFAKSMENEPD